MKNLHLLKLKNIALDKAWNRLEKMGVELVYGNEASEGSQLYIYLTKGQHLQQLPWIDSCLPASFPEVDWHQQWELHSASFHEGKAHISLESYGIQSGPIQLLPGEGFGDLSHPTTCLMLELMASQVKGKTFIDMGCGSGILSLAAIAMGAKRSFGIDIDPKAIEHAKHNATLNEMADRSHFCFPNALPIVMPYEPCVIGINMITTEQTVAWGSVSFLHQHNFPVISSGVQHSQREAYLAQAAMRGWSMQNEIAKDGWLAFHFV